MPEPFSLLLGKWVLIHRKFLFSKCHIKTAKLRVEFFHPDVWNSLARTTFYFYGIRKERKKLFSETCNLAVVSWLLVAINNIPEFFRCYFFEAIYFCMLLEFLGCFLNNVFRMRSIRVKSENLKHYGEIW